MSDSNSSTGGSSADKHPEDENAESRKRKEMSGVNPTPDRQQSVGDESERVDVGRELDALLSALARNEPQPPPLLADDFDSIAGIISEIVVSEPITHTQQLLQELNAARSQLATAHTELQFLQQRNQVQADRIDASAVRVQHLKSRTQQLAQQSQIQIDRAQATLAAMERIRAEIVTSLERIGDWEQIESLAARIEAARQAVESERDRVITGQQVFYDSLETIHARVNERSQAAESKLAEYEESLDRLSQTITTDRDRIDNINVEIDRKISDLRELHDQITHIHSQIVETSQGVRSRVDEIEIQFGQIAGSIGSEKQQFYALTAEAIDKAEAIRIQLATAFQQIADDRQTLVELKNSLSSLQQTVRKEAQQKLVNFDRRDRELIALCNDLKSRHKDAALTIRRQSIWLWVLSAIVGVLFVMIIRLSIAR